MCADKTKIYLLLLKELPNLFLTKIFILMGKVDIFQPSLDDPQIAVCSANTAIANIFSKDQTLKKFLKVFYDFAD